MQNPSSSRTPSQLSVHLQKSLNAYAMSAAAVGAVLAATPAGAEIIYTPANQHITDNMRFDLDVNGDGITDFKLVNDLHLSTTPFGDDLSVRPAVAGNEFVGKKVRFSYFAAALALGAHIGSKAPFLGRNANMAFASLTALTYVSGGPWKNVKNKYLGLKFLINGEIHYGWARLTVLTFSHKQQVESLLTGYAYETVANRPIVAGQTVESDASESTVSRGSLGALAQGAASPAR